MHNVSVLVATVSKGHFEPVTAINIREEKKWSIKLGNDIFVNKSKARIAKNIRNALDNE